MQRLTHTFGSAALSQALRCSYWRWLLLLLPVIAVGGEICIPVKTAVVQAQQPTPQGLSILADTQEANSKTQVVTARGNVRLSYPLRQVRATANLAQFFIKQNRVVLTGNVSIVQNGNTLKGESVTYLINEGKFVANPQANQQVRSNYIIPEQGGKGLTILSNTQEANTKAETVTARGNVRLTYPDKKLQAKASTAQYNIKEKQIVLSGNVFVVSNGSSLQAETITYLIDRGQFIATPKPGQAVQSIYVIPDKQ